MASTSVKVKRLETRVTPQQKALIERAAALSGRTVSDFVLSTLQTAAEETIRSHQIIELTARSTEAFVATLLEPPAPNEKLREAIRRYEEIFGSW